MVDGRRVRDSEPSSTSTFHSSINPFLRVETS
jgi:hypothetical protein